MKTMLLALEILTVGMVPAAAVNAAQSETLAVGSAVHQTYFVHYRTCAHERCRIAGPFPCLHDAQNEASHLASHGYIIDGIVAR